MLGIDGDLFHVGILVPDLASAMDELSAAHGVTWASVQDRTMDIWLPGSGAASFRLALAYSCEGPVHFELMQGEQGSPWHAATHTGLHHFGYWTDHVGSETERLLAEGWELVLSTASPDAGYGRFSYLRSPSGVLFEPINRSSQPRFEAWWAGGELAPASTA
jgi:hypothetical protein